MDNPDGGGPVVSVVIPTYNRQASLLRTLASMGRQSYPPELLEVIVVDDGSTDGTESVMHTRTQFALRYVRQGNMGATAARNHGAHASRGAILVFVDDDMALYPEALASIVNDLQERPETVCLGSLRLPAQLTEQSTYAWDVQERIRREAEEGYISYQKCLTGFLAIRRSDFHRIGMFRDPTGDWPSWDDLEFGYRAHLQGYRFWRSRPAVAEHWDSNLLDVEAAMGRWYRAGRAASKLVEQHPALRHETSLFRDKEPIAWGNDAPALIGRKLARQATASRPAMWFFRHMLQLVERRAPRSGLQQLLFRWTQSSYVFRGYRDGLRRIRSQQEGGNRSSDLRGNDKYQPGMMEPAAADAEEKR